MLNRTVSIICIMFLLSQVQILAAAVQCNDAEQDAYEHSAHDAHTCCVAVKVVRDQENCEQCASCEACSYEEQNASSQNNGALLKLLESLAYYHLPVLYHYQTPDVSVVNDKHIDFNLVTRVTLPPSSPVLLL